VKTNECDGGSENEDNEEEDVLKFPYVYVTNPCLLYNSRFARCRHLTKTTRIPFVFSALCKF